MHLACKSLQRDLVTLLMDHNVDINAQDNEGQTPLHYALNSDQKGKSECIEILLQHNLDINVKDNNGMTPMHLAASRRAVRSLQLLIEHGADFSLDNKEETSALSEALKYLPLPTMEAMKIRLDKSMHVSSK